MATFVIFWAAVFALLFFLLKIFFEAIVSAINAFMASAAKMIPIIGKIILSLLVIFALSLLYDIVNEIRTGSSFWDVACPFVIFIIIIGIAISIFGGFGVVLLVLLDFIVSTVLRIIELAASGLEWLAEKCEDGYVKFLNVIIKRIDKC